jgi:hypothetical protein
VRGISHHRLPSGARFWLWLAIAWLLLIVVLFALGGTTVTPQPIPDWLV